MGASRRSRRVRVAAAILSLAAVSAACGGDSRSESASGGSDGKLEKSSIKVGILPTPDYVAAQIAIDEGYFEEEGLEVTTEVMANGNSAPSIVGGSYDIAGMNWISFLLAITSDVPLEAVAEGSLGVPGYAQFLVRADSSATILADLSGEKVGVVAGPGNCDLIAQAVLEEEGVDTLPSWVTLAVPDMPASIQRGNVAGSCVPEPLASALLASEDFRSVHDLFSGEIGEEFPVSGFVTSSKFADENPNTVAAYQRAIQKAIDLVNSDESVLRPALLKYTTLTEDQAASMSLPSYTDNVTDFSNLQRAADLIEAQGVAEDVAIPSGS